MLRQLMRQSARLAQIDSLGQNKMEQQTPTPPPPKSRMKARRAKTRHFPILNLGGRGSLSFPFILWSLLIRESSFYIFIGWKHWSVTRSHKCHRGRPYLLYSKRTFLPILSGTLQKGALEHGITRKSYKEFFNRVKRTFNVISQESLDC